VEVLALIPARGGSKGIRRKNLLPLAGKPLILHTLGQAKGAKSISRSVVSTEDSEIAQVARQAGVEVLQRPDRLAEDDTPMMPVILHALEMLEASQDYKPEITLLLQPTAPLRRSEHIDEALHLLSESGASSVVSVSEVPGHYHPAWQLKIGEGGELALWSGEAFRHLATRRQELSATYTRNGAIYALKTERLIAERTLYARPCMAYRMPQSASVNIDAPVDIGLAEWWLAHGAETEGASPDPEALWR
jgi:CMP-N-acetylneuraminic acid synthetase